MKKLLLALTLSAAYGGFASAADLTFEAGTVAANTQGCDGAGCGTVTDAHGVAATAAADAEEEAKAK